MKQRKNITISEGMLERAERVMRVRGFDDFSEFVAHLIREEWERRHPGQNFDEMREESAPPATTPPPSSIPTHYGKRKRKLRPQT